MVQYSVCRKDLGKVKGKILKDFSCSVSYEEFIKSTKFKNIKTFAFVLALISMFIGLILPLIVGFFTSLKDFGTDVFQVNVISNSVMAIVFCLPLSLAFIIGALPLYKKIVSATLSHYGYKISPKVLKRQIA